MKKQMAKVFFNGTWRVIYDDTKNRNAYRVTKDGKKVVDYDDFVSCLNYITLNILM